MKSRVRIGHGEGLNVILKVMRNHWWEEGKALTSSVAMYLRGSQSNLERDCRSLPLSPSMFSFLYILILHILAHSVLIITNEIGIAIIISYFTRGKLRLRAGKPGVDAMSKIIKLSRDTGMGKEIPSREISVSKA